MTWRSVVITTPARLTKKHQALVIQQDSGEVSVPLEDIAVLVLDCPQVTLTSQLLAASASQQISIITVDETHTPNGVLLPYLPHSRALQVMRKQLTMSGPHKKRLWQHIVRQKLFNQAIVLQKQNHATQSARLKQLANDVGSGDPNNLEAQGAQVYFRTLFGETYTRSQDRFYNAALNYAYSIIRSAIARSLVGYGFLPAFGIHHCSEQNAFNLADDLIEPFRPIIDLYIVSYYAAEPEHELQPPDKANLVRILHQDILRLEREKFAGRSTLLALVDASVISLGQRLDDGQAHLVLPSIDTP